MKQQDFTTSFEVAQSPMQVFDAINNVRGWWSEEVYGTTDKLGAEYFYHFKTVHQCKMKIEELIPGEQVTWRVLDNYFDFIKDQKEWKGTKISFQISRNGSKTRLVFTHFGLSPADECYHICHDAWTQYIQQSLKGLIETGKGAPNGKEGGFNEWLIAKHGLNG